MGGARLIEALEHPGPERAAIDDRHGELEALQRAAIHHASPLAVAAAVELVGVLGVEQGLGLAIAGLLPEVRTRVLAAVVPDERPRREGDQEPLVLEPPADVHIVAGLAKLGIEPVDRLEGLTAEGHVAAGDVLGDLVAHQDVRRLPRRGRDAGGQPAVLGRQVRPPHRRRPAPHELMDQMDQPVRVGHAVGIGVGDHGTRGASQPGVSRDTQAVMRLMDGPDRRESREDLPGIVGRAIIHDDDLVVRIIEGTAAIAGTRRGSPLRCTSTRPPRPAASPPGGRASGALKTCCTA